MHSRLDEQDTARAANRIAVTMVVTFLVTFGGLYWRQRASEAPAPATARVPPPTLARPPMPAATAVESSTVAVPLADKQSVGEQPPNPVPVVLRVRHIGIDSRVEGSIRSLSANPLSVTLVGKSQEGDETARVSIQLGPFETKSFSTNDGMDLQPGGQLLAESQGYQDRPAVIP